MADIISDILKKARAAHEAGVYQDADRLYTDVINIWEEQKSDPLEPSPDDVSLARAYNDRGYCRYLMVCFDEAIEDLTIALGLNPLLAPAYYNRGTIHYRLASSSPEVSLRKALDDLHEAVKLQPENPNFQHALQDCKKLIVKVVDDMDEPVLDLTGIDQGKLARLLFLLDSGDPGTGSSEAQRHRNKLNAFQGCQALHTALVSPRILCWISTLLQFRAWELSNQIFVEFPEGTEAADWAVRKGEDLLVFVEACESLSIPFHGLRDKLVQVQNMMKLTDTEKRGNFFLYAENLMMCRICDKLTPSLVQKLFLIMKHDEQYKKYITGSITITDQQLKEEEGVKEILFFYLIRMLEYNRLLNRIYTDNLKNLFKQMAKEERKFQCSDDEKKIIAKIIQDFEYYPNECKPTGLCVIFCVTDDRPGAEYEIAKIDSVFHDLLGFTVLTERNPTKETLERYTKELRKTKYNFYDSVVFWCISHGMETEILLAKHEPYPREDFIYNFSLLENFRKKPKIFFMCACRGCKTIQVREEGGMNVAADGGAIIRPEDIPLINQDISSVYYQMDRVIASATLPEKLAFRLDDKGSIFVDTVCTLLENYRGKNLTNMLEECSRLIHRILFASSDSQFPGSAKQACYYESTLQKTYTVPHQS